MPRAIFALSMRAVLGTIAILAAARPAFAGEAAGAALFEKHIAPVLVTHCLDCHNASAASGGLVLANRKAAMAGGESGEVLIAGSPDESYLLDRIADGSMPPEGKGERLSPEVVAKFRDWIAAGCNWPEERKLSLYEFTTARRAGLDWWSLAPIQRPGIRGVKDSSSDNPIDAFILAKLKGQGLELSPPADRLTLLRRATFDLTGLPPTPEEAQAFLADNSQDAYPRLIDRLLNSKHYGERWAQHWLDVVRFSESKGFERDRLRENSWRYRDWVIDAFNRDLPYDEFVRRQIAGDALSPDDANAAIPTGFLVTGPNNDVGNGSELERKRERADELDDFVTNTTAAFLGLTVGCARCHDHKFDPIPTVDYYRLVAVFAGLYYGDRPLATDAQRQDRKQKVAEIEQQLAPIAERLADIDARLASLKGDKSSPVKNEIEFAPADGRFVRIEIDQTADGSEPCIDELEIYAAGSDANLATQAGSVASASSVLPGFAIHRIAHLNDGNYGNEHSWIAGERGHSWAQIELKSPAAIHKLVWSRDRQRHYTDRVAAKYEILVSQDGTTWRVVADWPRPKNDSPGLGEQFAKLNDERTKVAAEQKRLEEAKQAIPDFATTWAPIGKPPEPTHLLKRGDVTTPGAAVTPGALSAIQGLNADLGGDELTDRQRRLALADWIASAQNPLTARVIVNRLWQYHFGAGFVDNPSDLGFSSGRPSHPELLDFLAAELTARGWSLKQMHRAMMLSATYQQACQPNQRAAHIDSDNRLLWRANRGRLEAESIRDSILFTAGTLDESLGGPSFRLFKYTDGNIPIYEPLAGEDRSTWRRTIYRHVVRSQSVPFLDVFDCPDSSVMTARRSRTTTAPQALSLLNDDFVIHQSEQLVARLERDAGGDRIARLRRAVWLIFNRPATEEELQWMSDFVERHGLARLGRALWNTNEFLYVN